MQKCPKCHTKYPAGEVCPYCGFRQPARGAAGGGLHKFLKAAGELPSWVKATAVSTAVLIVVGIFMAVAVLPHLNSESQPVAGGPPGSVATTGATAGYTTQSAISQRTTATAAEGPGIQPTAAVSTAAPNADNTTKATAAPTEKKTNAPTEPPVTQAPPPVTQATTKATAPTQPPASTTRKTTTTTDPANKEYTYTTGAKGVTLTKYLGSGGNVVIPSTINGKPVIDIGSIFLKNSQLTSVTIPNGVTSIGDNAFDTCKNLTSIVIPSNVISIGDYAFFSCTGLTSLIISNGVISIGTWAFVDCDGLTSITIPSSVNNIKQNAFAQCHSLITAKFEGNAPATGYGIFASNCYDNNVHIITVYYHADASGWTSPTWNGYPTAIW